MKKRSNRSKRPETGVDAPAALEARTDILRNQPFLHQIYREWYAEIAAVLPPGPERVLEIGSGGGFLRDVIPELVTSDILLHRVVDLVLDGCRLPFGRDALRAVVMTNVFHHLPEVRSFFGDALACVRPGGAVVMIEPWVTPWSRLIYSKLHYEPFDPGAAVWELPAGNPVSGGNNALPWIVFARDRAEFEHAFPGWRLQSITLRMPFRYLLSGGVAGKPRMPGWTFGFWRRVEHLFDPWLMRSAMFARIVLVRREAAP